MKIFYYNLLTSIDKIFFKKSLKLCIAYQGTVTHFQR